jgi:hypothetical protein
LKKIRNLSIILFVAILVVTGYNNISVVQSNHSKKTIIGTTIAKGETNIGTDAVRRPTTPSAIDIEY